jgi:hypothetical protein
MDLVRTEDSMGEEQIKALIKAAVDDLHLQVRKELATARQAIANDRTGRAGGGARAVLPARRGGVLLPTFGNRPFSS